MSKVNLRALVGYSNAESGAVDPYARIQELEARLELLTNQKPDLASMSEEDVEILASETVTRLLKAAHERLRTATEQAQAELKAANAEAEQILSDARKTADQLMNETVANADRTAATARSQAERMISDAERSAEALLKAAREESARLEAESLRDRQQTKTWIENAFSGVSTRLQTSEDQLQILRSQIDATIETVSQQRTEISRYRMERAESANSVE